ncbi:MAG: hypothetical protein E7E64_16020 [Clostridium celatum]|nr:hypothetical protein [Clostridium celatum]MDU4980903.1 hypothetical protein [Clostridium celatum]
MKKELEKYEIEEIDIKMLFAVTAWGFLLILSTLLKIICDITNIYKVNLIYVILINICLCTIGISLFKVYKYLSLKFNLFLKIYIGMIIIIYILTLGFIIIKNILMNNNIYFKGEVSYIILIISFANLISTILLLFIISIKISKESIKKNSNKIGFLKNIIILIPLILSLGFTLSFGTISVVFSKPEEINVIDKSIKYNIRVDGFLVARNEATFIYNKSINSILMKKLYTNEVPPEILAENNDYY